ncbi:MAG: glycosyltransferase family 2 protein [Bacteroidota bacterium]
MSDFVSVIIPCHNVEKYVAQGIESVLAQTYPHFELILVDNNSTDGTPSILAQYAQRFPRKIQFYSQTKAGAPAARNMGLAHSKGNWIQFLDADDLMLSNKLERQLAMLTEQDPLLVGTPRYQKLDGSTFIMEPWEDPIMGLFEGLSQGNTCCNLWNRKYLDKVNAWDESRKFQQDYDLIFRIIQVNDQVIHDHEVSVVIRERPSGQITKKDPTGIRKALIDLRIDMLDYLNMHRPVYLKKHEFFYLQTLYRFIRYLAEYDIELADEYYQNHLPHDFSPQHSKETYIPLWNAKMVNLIGFKKAEYFKHFVKRSLGLSNR